MLKKGWQVTKTKSNFMIEFNVKKWYNINGYYKERRRKMAELLEQAALIEELLEFNKKTSILKIPPSTEELKDMREKAKKVKIFKFEVDSADIEFIEQIAEFADTYKVE